MDPGPLSLLPAAVAVALALLTRHVVLSLFAAAWVGGTLASGWNPLSGLLHVVDPLVLDAVADRGHVKVTLFSLFIGGAVGVMGEAGGTTALVERLVLMARGRRGGMVMGWLAGLVVFFDDYANCLVVGNAMQPVADRLRISREKLAYIVDSTAAPIASVALVGTWVGYEVGLLGDGLRSAGLDRDAYAFFIEGLGYRFYSWFTIVFVGSVAITGRDFGPMLAAERRAGTVPAAPREPAPARLAWVAAIPILALLGVAGWVLWSEGSAAAPPGARFFEVVGSADGYDAMLRGSLCAIALAVILSVALGALRPARAIDAAIRGMGSLFEALVVLFLAWALGAVIGELGAASWLVGMLRGAMAPGLLPAATFLVAAATSFATGTSFGTMAILVPIALPLALAISPDPAIALATSGSVLTGACFGDHCSPISDTTVLSSLGSGCDHGAHVRTQLPYALAAAAVSLAFGFLPAGLGVPAWACLLAGSVACVGLVRWWGRPADPTCTCRAAASPPAPG